MAEPTSLLLSQAYRDAWDDYTRSLTDGAFARWDHVILTASNERQAEGFRAQLRARQDAGLLPPHTRFAVLADRDGERVGSGGATLGVLRYIAEQTGQADFAGLRIMVIHSGGDSRRAPQYSALGKLFSPVPHELENGRPATLFDELLIATAAVPARIREGMLLLSGDVLLLFNPLQITFDGRAAAAISFKADAEIGENHGVFLGGEDGNVRRFLHKQDKASLVACGAVDDRYCVDIDTGAVLFSAELLRSLFDLIATDGGVDEEKYARFVNSRTRLSLYGDFLYPLATDATLEDFYKQMPEGPLCPELTAARTAVWAALRPYRMKLLRLSPAQFIHLGTSREILALMTGGVTAYADLGWSGQVACGNLAGAAGYHSVVAPGATVGKNVYLEASCVHRGARIGDNVLLSSVDVYDEQIPDGLLLHGLTTREGKFVVRILGVTDNPKTGVLLGAPLSDLMKRIGLAEADLWAGESHSLWEAALYPVCDTPRAALAAALNLYAITQGQGDVTAWKNAPRQSLADGFGEADPIAAVARAQRMDELVRLDRVLGLIGAGRPAKEGKGALGANGLTPAQEEWLAARLRHATPGEAMRLYYYVGVALGGVKGERYIAACFHTVSRIVVGGTLGRLPYHRDARILKNRHTVTLPLRVNWGGGWSDTPPYCNENGGAVLNAAIRLGGTDPVQVTVERIQDKKIIFDSRDMDVHGEFDCIEPLQTQGAPYDPFALQKACLLVCGIIPAEGGDLGEILDRLGGGFVIHSEVVNVPKGSGLGTSSILAAACTRAVLECMGIPHTQEDLYDYVLCIEQIMSTGGGWQDQVGGLCKGVKWITTAPGARQTPRVTPVEISESTKRELEGRFCLISTGQRRLARNLLRSVIGRYIGGDPDSLYALAEIKRVAADMRRALQMGDVDLFATLLDRHWSLSRQIDSGSTNALIDRIFEIADPCIDGRMVSGAGGGGFLQVILKKDVPRQELQERLTVAFPDSLIRVWDCNLLWQ